MNKQLHKSKAEFVASFAPWSHFITLEFSDYVPRARAVDALHQWLRSLAVTLAHGHVPFAFGLEPHKSGVLHLHVLVALPAGITVREIEGEWHCADKLAGYSRILRGHAEEWAVLPWRPRFTARRYAAVLQTKERCVPHPARFRSAGV